MSKDKLTKTETEKVKKLPSYCSHGMIRCFICKAGKKKRMADELPRRAFWQGVIFLPVAYIGWRVIMNSLLLCVVLGGCTVDVRGDLDGNCVINLLDMDMLVPAVYSGNHDLHYDLTDDGVVDYADVTEMLLIAGHSDWWGTSYLVGDANWHGEVDARDLNILGRSWGQTDAVWWGDCHLDPPWCYIKPGGDFNADGTVNAADLNLLAVNWQRRLVRPVPEPSAIVLMISFLLGGAICRGL